MGANRLGFADIKAVCGVVADLVNDEGFSVDGSGKSAFEEADRRLNVQSNSFSIFRWRRAEALGMDPFNLDLPRTITDDEDPLEDGLAVLERHADANAAYISKAPRKRYFMFPVRKEPFAVVFVGDPHLDNKGTNLNAFIRDMQIIRASGMRAVNMGDILDNFQHAGRLARKQANNRMTVAEGKSAARWMVRDSGIAWDLHLIGNHDAWAEEEGIIQLAEWARAGRARVADWIGGLTYAWDGGQFNVLAAHDFKGHSIHNALHGLMRRATEDGWADLYAAGHRHTSAKGDTENGFRRRHYHFLRVKGYKDEDEYAVVKGFPVQAEGASGVAVIDPLSHTQEGRCTLFHDIEAGADYLRFMKARAA